MMLSGAGIFYKGLAKSRHCAILKEQERDQKEKKMKVSELPVFQKLNRIIFCVVIPVLVVALVLFMIFAPKTIALDEDYYLAGQTIKVSGGEPVIGPGELVLWGSYPWVYGTVDGKGFRIDLKEKNVEVFKTPEAYERFLREEALDPALCVTPGKLRSDSNLQLRLKEALYHRKAEK